MLDLDNFLAFSVPSPMGFNTVVQIVVSETGYFDIVFGYGPKLLDNTNNSGTYSTNYECSQQYFAIIILTTVWFIEVK